MKKVILIAVMMLVGLTYGQNINSLYTYESINGIEATQSVDTEIRDEYNTELNDDQVNKNKNYSSPIGLYSYESLSRINEDLKNVKKSKKDVYAETIKKDNESSRKNIVIRKAKTEVLVRYNGKYSSIKLIDLKGNKVDANFSKKYRGLIVPRSKESKKYFLEVEKADKSKVFYHQVTL